MIIARPVDAQPVPICPEGQGRPAVPTQRILIVTDAWAPQVNGVVRSYENIIRELRLLGHDVAVISPRDFPTLPLPGYREIALAVFPYRRLARMIRAMPPTVSISPSKAPWAGPRGAIACGIVAPIPRRFIRIFRPISPCVRPG